MSERDDDAGLESTAAQPMDSTAAAPLGETRSSSPSVERPLGPGTKVGKFVLEERLGAGAMGVVYAARDPELDRRVAIKLIKSRHGSDELRTRLYREAQALARVAHPNVVGVYEVGEHAGQVFIAMELITGDTLRTWLGAKQHTTDEILAMLIAAGRGLCAAHVAELVHRDFKPDNVLVGTDGRARVTDFGLARGQGEAADGELRTGSPVTSPLDAQLTTTGALLGTPVYASPEQLAGARVGVASDQFSFCVTAYEALYGERPFAATTLQEQIEAVTTGKLSAVPSGRRVPPRVHRAIVRGLSPKPEDRFPSMDGLLAELGAPKRRARSIAIVAGLSCVVGGATALGVLATRSPPGPTCDDEAAVIDTVWTGARQAQLQAKLAGTPFADKQLATRANAFRRYAAEWSTRRRSACTDARRGDEAAQRVVACLDARRSDYERFVQLVMADPEKVPDTQIVLEPIATCPTTAATIRDAREALLGAFIRAMEGDSAPLDALAAAVDTVAYPPLQAETLIVLWERAFLAKDDVHSEDFARRASKVAEASGDERAKILAGVALARMLVRRNELDAAERELDHAEAALAHYGAEIYLDARTAQARGDLLLARGKLTDAATAYETTYALDAALGTPDDRLPLAAVYDALGRDQDAAAVRAWIDAHPGRGLSDELRTKLEACNTAFSAGELDRVVACESLTTRRDLAREPAAALWLSIALAHLLRPDPVNARRAYGELAKIHEAMGSTDQLVKDLNSAGLLSLELGDPTTATAQFRRSIELATKLASGDPLAKARAGLGRALVSDGQLAEGVKELEWALPRLEVMKDPPRESIARTRLALADALWRRAGDGDRDRARVTARSAKAVAREQHDAVAGDTTPLGKYLRSMADRLVKTVDDWFATHR